MEYVGQQNIKRLCNFYVSDLHLSVMLLPYISKQINEDVEITTIFEKLEKKEIETILDKLNVKNKEKILNINWFNYNKDTNDKTINKIRENINEDKKNIIIIGGNNEYVEKNNDIVMKLLNQKNSLNNVKIINCYNIEESKIDINSILKEYDGILNTSGENEISAID